MADKKITLELNVETGEMKNISKELDKNTKSTKKLTKSTKQLEHATGGARRQIHGVARMSSNSTKHFSKMQQGLGKGSSGLVGAYATLAANVFAATAAFQALRGAAQTEQLISGLEAVGAASGRNLRALAEQVRDAADGALSLDAALRSAAVGASAEFSDEQLIGLTRVAKGAALALGRDVGDAQDRLVRGAAKLEPEILDELGIFVRLDDATAKFAATIGKTSAQLTNLQRRQAFTNAILEQGQRKFSDISDAVDANPYDKLAATMADLTRVFMNFVNTILGPFVSLLSENTVLLAGLFMVVTKSIIVSALPALTKMGDKLRQHGILAQRQAANEIANLNSTRVAMMKKVEAQGYGFKAYDKMISKISLEKDNIKLLTAAREELQRIIDRNANSANKGARDRANRAKQEQKDVDNLIKQEEKHTPRMGAGRLRTQRSEAVFEGRGERILSGLDEPGGGMEKWTKGFKDARKEGKKYRKNMKDNSMATQMFGGKMKFLSKGLFKGGVAFKSFGLASKVAVKGIFTAIPVIGQLLFAFDLLIIGIKKLFKWLGGFRGETSELDKANQSLKTSIESVTTVLDKSNLQYKTQSDNLKISSAAIDNLIVAVDRQAEAGRDAQEEMSILGKIMSGVAELASKRWRQFTQLFVNFGAAVRQTFLEMKLGFLNFIGDDAIIKWMNGLIKVFNKIAEKTGREKMELFNQADLDEDKAKILGTIKDIQIERDRALTSSTIGLIDASAIDAFDAFASTLMGTGPAAEELQKAFGTDDINSFIESLFSGGIVAAEFSDTIKEQSDIMELFANDALKDGVNQQELFLALLKAGTAQSRVAGSALKTLGDAFKNEGQKVDKFMTSLGKKSSVSEAAASFNTFAKQIEILGGESVSISEEFEQASTSTKQFIDNLSKGVISATQDEIDFWEKRKKAVKEGSKDWDEAVDALETYRTLQGKAIAESTADANTLIQTLNRRLLTEKTILATIKRQSAAVKKAGKNNFEAVKASVDLDNQAARTKMNTLDAQIAVQEGALKLSKEETALAYIKGELTGAELEIFTSLLDLEEKRNSESAKIVSKAEKMAKSLLAQVNIAKMNNKLEQSRGETLAKELKTRKLIENAKKGLGAILTPADELRAAKEAANLKITAAVQELDIMTEKAKLEMFILAMRLHADKVALTTIRKIVEESKKQLKVTQDIQKEKIKGLRAEAEAVPYTTGGGGADYMNFGGTATNILADMDVAGERMDQIVQDRVDKLSDQLDEALAESGGESTPFIEGLITQIETAAPTFGEKMQMMKESTKTFTDELAKLGPEGEYASQLFTGLMNIGQAFENLKDSGLKSAEGLAALGSIVGNIGAIQAKASAAKIAGIDQEIAAEKKRDGKSAASLAKIKALEKKKEAAKRKAFEQNKKMQMGETVINTAAAIMKAAPNYAEMALMAIMGAAQLAIISSAKYLPIIV